MRRIGWTGKKARKGGGIFAIHPGMSQRLRKPSRSFPRTNGPARRSPRGFDHAGNPAAEWSMMGWKSLDGKKGMRDNALRAALRIPKGAGWRKRVL